MDAVERQAVFWSPPSVHTRFLLVVTILIVLMCHTPSITAASFGSKTNENGLSEDSSATISSSQIPSALKSRQKRFILHFQMPQPVGHFRIAMMPPFLSSMMANIPAMIRRNFFGTKETAAEGESSSLS